MKIDKSRIQSCVDHINTAIDVDPWAKELVIEMGKEILEQLNNSTTQTMGQLNNDDIETIRIHLSAIKEQLANQHRWKEAQDYQRLIDRFMAFAEQAERKKDTIQKFHDYQVEWLKSHYDIEFEPQLEEMIIRFLHDTANRYMMEEGGWG